MMPHSGALQLKLLWQAADAPTMGNDIHSVKPDMAADVPVLPMSLPSLPNSLGHDTHHGVSAPEPRPITISPQSSLATSITTSGYRLDNSPHLARTVPISSPSVDMTTPPRGLPRLTPSLPSAMPTAPPAPILEPELAEAVLAVVGDEESRFVTDGPQHPMAHLMPPRTRPTEAQLRASELRAAKKKKARRAKVLAAVAIVAFGALAGPPLAAWVVAAINESGSTESDPDPTGTDSTGQNGPDDGVSSMLDDIDTLNSIVADNNASVVGSND